MRIKKSSAGPLYWVKIKGGIIETNTIDLNRPKVASSCSCCCSIIPIISIMISKGTMMGLVHATVISYKHSQVN